MNTHTDTHPHTRYMHVSIPPIQHWKKRWCILVMTSSNNEPCLDYYRDEADTYCSLPIRRISLTQCSKVEMDLQHSNYKHVFAIHLPERVFYFAAPSE